MQDISTSLSRVTGGKSLTADQARAILQKRFPHDHVELPREITGDGRSLRTPGGGWRGAVFFPGQAVQMEVTPKGRVKRDYLGQGDL